MAGVVVSKKAKTENVLPMIPDHVIVEILARLPVKTLLRFRCVCKTWYSVISDPPFCNKLHRMRPCVLICEKSKTFSTITIESLLTIKNKAPTPLFLPWEPKPEPDGSTENQFLGSCNGLICVDHKSSSPDRSWSGLILWNPSTRKFKRPPRLGCYRDDFRTYAWFGYDESVDDYKLVWLNCCGPCRTPTVTALDEFTLKSDTWRRPPVDHIELHGIDVRGEQDGFPKSIGVLFNGAIHWVTYYYPRSRPKIRIVALDLATEKFQTARISSWSVGSQHLGRKLILGCLCLCSNNFEEEEDGCG